MSRREVSLDSRPVLSHAADAVGTGDLLFVAGVLPVDASGALVGGESVADQARHVLGDLGEILAAGGCSTADIAALNVYLTAIDDRAEVEAPLREALGEAHPAGTLVEVRGLAVPGARIEVDAVAVIA